MLRIPIMKGYELDTMIQKSCKFLRQCQIGYGSYWFLPMHCGNKSEDSLHTVPCASCCNHTDHPDHTKQMVCMFMGQKNVMDLRHGNICILKLAHDAVAAACIYQEIFIIILNCKTSIITSGHKGIAQFPSIISLSIWLYPTPVIQISYKLKQ